LSAFSGKLEGQAACLRGLERSACQRRFTLGLRPFERAPFVFARHQRLERKEEHAFLELAHRSRSSHTKLPAHTRVGRTKDGTRAEKRVRPRRGATGPRRRGLSRVDSRTLPVLAAGSTVRDNLSLA